MFIRVIEEEYQDSILININTISAIYEDSSTIIINGVHGEGSGVYHLDEQSMKNLLEYIRIIN